MRTVLAVALWVASMTVGIGAAHADEPTCVPRAWFSVCVDNQNHWSVCDGGGCHPAPAPAVEIPGLPAPWPVGQ